MYIFVVASSHGINKDKYGSLVYCLKFTYIGVCGCQLKVKGFTYGLRIQGVLIRDLGYDSLTFGV